MLIPILIFVVCLGAGAAAAAQWLPPLAAGTVGGLAFFVVCGLLGAALALAGLHIYLIAQALDDIGRGFGGKGAVIASGLEDLLFDAGFLSGLAFAVYLLAPPPDTADEPAPALPLA